MTMEKTNKAKPASEKHSTVAFVNWVTKIGKVHIRSVQGFPLQQHPNFTNKQEDLLIAMAKKHLETTGKALTLNMKVTINFNNKNVEYDIDALLAELGHTADGTEEAAAV